MFFICLTAVASSILNSYEKFSIPALTPAILNISLIISVLFFSPFFSEPVYALAWGVDDSWNLAITICNTLSIQTEAISKILL